MDVAMQGARLRAGLPRVDGGAGRHPNSIRRASASSRQPGSSPHSATPTKPSCGASRCSGSRQRTSTPHGRSARRCSSADARCYSGFDTDTEARTVGPFCVRDGGIAGASPDGLVGDDGLLELKCPREDTHMLYLGARSAPERVSRPGAGAALGDRPRLGRLHELLSRSCRRSSSASSRTQSFKPHLMTTCRCSGQSSWTAASG